MAIQFHAEANCSTDRSVVKQMDWQTDITIPEAMPLVRLEKKKKHSTQPYCDKDKVTSQALQHAQNGGIKEDLIPAMNPT